MKKRSSFDTLKTVWIMAKPYKYSLLVRALASFFLVILGNIQPFILAVLIDQVFYYKNADFLGVSTLLYLILLSGTILMFYFGIEIWAYIENKFVLSIRLKTFKKIIYSKAEDLSGIKTGDMAERIEGDANQFAQVLIRNLSNLFNYIIYYIVSFICLISINLKLAAAAFILVPITVLFSCFLGKRAGKISKDYRTNYGSFIAWVIEHIKGLREIKLFSAERHVTRAFINKASVLLRLNVKMNRVDVITDRLTKFIMLLSRLIMYTVSALLVIKGELTVGLFVAAMEYYNIMNTYLDKLTSINIDYEKRKTYIDRVLEILERKTEADENQKEELAITKGAVSFKNVTFSYDKNKIILKNLNLEISGGQNVALVGGSGEGKSTIADLLLGFYKPNEGTIEIDGQDISKCKLSSLRKSIGIVRQDIRLFNESIRYNLKLGNEKKSDEELIEALKKASAYDFVMALPKGIDTVIGKNGSALSGGQKQRIILARIILKNPKLLILDEATSALDYATERAVVKALNEAGIGRTVITIAHRAEAILKSDKIAVIHNGQIAEYGSHKELIKKSGYYEKLFREQYLNLEGEGEESV